MKRGFFLAILLAISCQSASVPVYTGAAVTAAAGVAMAGAYRAVTGGCWASCPPGTECDEASGTCTDLPCRNECPADSQCVRLGKTEQCVRRMRDTSAPEAPKGGASQAEPRGEPDPCRGLCFSGEKCEVDAGVADCVPVPPPPPQ